MKRINDSNNLLPIFSGEDWQTWVPRGELAPHFEKQYEGDEVRLNISAGGCFQSYGAWRCEVTGIREDASYAVLAEYVVERVRLQSD